MKKLPKIYKNPITKKITNNIASCLVKNNTESITNSSLEERINSVFKSLGNSYNINVLITTQDKTYDTSLIAKDRKYIYTLDNDAIAINDIVSFEKR